MSAPALQCFGFDSQLVRVVERDDGTWFVANDVCAALEVNNSRQALSRLEDDEKGVISNDTPGGEQRMAIVSESGLYALIFTSRKAVAVRFRKWVTGEVLPALRKRGRYEMGEEMPQASSAGIDAPFLGTRDEREQMRVAVLLVRECKDLYGVAAGRQMWQKLGFPVPDADLPPDISDPSAPVEGDMILWGQTVGLKPTKREATHKAELYQSYCNYCSRRTQRPMHPDRFEKMLLAMFGTEEHPEMFQVVITRPRSA